MKRKKVDKYTIELLSTGSVAFMYKGMLYVIVDTTPENGGYMVAIHDPYDLDTSAGGGLCTGSAKDSIEFLLPQGEENV